MQILGRRGGKKTAAKRRRTKRTILKAGRHEKALPRGDI